MPRPQGRLDVERLLFVPQGNKRVVLNGISFSLTPGDSLAIIGNSGAGKTTLGKMLVGSILPDVRNVRLDLMDLRNWDQRQFGENIGYLPQDVQLFPASIKANIARMREDATDAEIFEAAQLADVHDMIASFRTAMRHSWLPMVRRSRADRSNASRSPAHFSAIPDWSCWTSRTPTSTPPAMLRSHERSSTPRSTRSPSSRSRSDLHCSKASTRSLLLVNGTVALFGMRQEVLQALASRGLSIEGGNFGHQIQ